MPPVTTTTLLVLILIVLSLSKVVMFVVRPAFTTRGEILEQNEVFMKKILP